ncbi:DUF4012 domain-containing protein [Leifsonia sp. ZF2019]|uniref:DUF4012 domain-containing protein n=1 Tax=Leifsonia sp. ZF2019 TaxID=2781978 RepID=UPI001CBFD057|nr:DUF4012 domain-containing protein [Leifsonia sp. ZF2019]UAJ80431.1 DUF4012 domain-containing protein [Leifsonia sp. ZF2019]
MAIGLSQEEAPPVAAEPDPPMRRRRHPLATGIAVALVLVVAGLVGWIALRGYLARQELYAALPAAHGIQSAIVSGDLGSARSSADELQKRAASAASLTGDPIWRAAEIVPWVGPNLAAVRTAAAATEQVSSRVIQPLVRVAATADPRTLALKDGRVDLAPLVAAQPVVARAQAAFHAAAKTLDTVDTSATIHPVGSAVDRLRELFAEATPAVDAVGNSARLLPAMLGADGARNYLLVAQNPAELRATGGLIGSVALIRADHGAISLVAQQAGTSIGPWTEPVAAIPDGPTGLFGQLIGTFIQDVNLTPDFPLAASTASRMWTSTNGGTVDGVITMDPVVLAALLRATGPVAVPSGETLTSDNAVSLLLSEVYRRYPDPAQQDAFFAAAAAAVFQRVAQGGTDGSALVSALAAAASSRRILIWSAHPAEQSILATTSLAGELPVSTGTTAGVGVYFNDSTGAKMDYYLDTSVAAGGAICRADGRPTTRVAVTLTNRAPADAATTLPDYVTGGGRFGIPPGSIQTRVAVYGPSGGLLAAITSGGETKSAISGTDRGRPVSVFTVTLAPGEQRTVDVDFLGMEQTGTGVSVTTTPTLPGTGATPDVGAESAVGSIAVDCASVVK